MCPYELRNRLRNSHFCGYNSPMNKTKLTAAAVRALAPPSTGRYVVSDAGQAGLQVLVRSTGSMSYQVRFRPARGGKEVLVTLGTVDEMSLAEARAAAMRTIIDEKAAVAAGLPAGSDISWTTALEELEERHLAGKGSCAEIMRTLRRECAAWEKRKLRSITKSDIVAVLDKIQDRGALTQRNRTLVYLRLAFNVWISRDRIAGNPTIGIKKLDGGERKGSRYLDERELILVIRAAQAADAAGSAKRTKTRTDPLWSDLFALLVLTGCRLSEVAEATVDEVDFKAGLWTIGAGRMKAGVAHVVPLVPAVLAVITRRVEIAERMGTSFLFTTTGATPAQPGAKLKLAMDAAIKGMNAGEPIPAWRNHDIRHGVRTGLVRIGVRPDIAERCLAHLPTGIAGLYDHHAYVTEKAAALTLWADHVTALAHG